MSGVPNPGSDHLQRVLIAVYCAIAVMVLGLAILVVLIARAILLHGGGA